MATIFYYVVSISIQFCCVYYLKQFDCLTPTLYSYEVSIELFIEKFISEVCNWREINGYFSINVFF